jgi:hypothetical protein
MERKRKVVLNHTFVGERFADHGLSVDSLSELICLKQMLVETAKDLWRKKNPDRKNLPSGYEGRLELKIFEITSGSVDVALERYIEVDSLALPLDDEYDELDEAANLVVESVAAANQQHSLPDGMPKRSLVYFSSYGKTLQDHEYFALKRPNQQEPVSYDHQAQIILSEWQPSEFKDDVYITGELRAVNLDRCSFSLLCADGSKIDGKFSPDKEAMMTEALMQHETKRLRIKAKVECDIHSGKVKRVTQVEDYFLDLTDDELFDPSAKPFWEIAAEISSQVPEEEWDKIPSDLAAHFDDYMYGKKATKP